MNGERTETFLPDIHRADYILRQLSLMSFPKWSLFTRFDVHLAAVPLPLPHRHSCMPLFASCNSAFQFHYLYSFDLSYRLCIAGESFFCEVTLDLSNRKACPVNNLPLGKYCLKSILHDSLALFALSALLKAEKSSRNTAERL